MNGLEGEDHLNDEEYARVHRLSGDQSQWSEAQWDAYWEIGADLSFERSMNARGYRVIENWNDQHGQPIPVYSNLLLDTYRKVYGDELLGAGLTLLRRLRGKVWKTKDGDELTVEEMTPSHASNLQAWLERRARVIVIAAQLEAGCAASDHDGGEHAHDAIESEFNHTLNADPLEYLQDLPLYKAIRARVSIARDNHIPVTSRGTFVRG